MGTANVAGAPGPGRMSTGVEGLDEVLQGGLIPGRSYLVRGRAGSGKTTLSYHFLAAGEAAGETGLFVSLGEQEDRIRQNVASIGIGPDAFAILDLSPRPEHFSEGKSYDLFSPADVEREPTTRQIVEAMEAVEPRRVVLDATMQYRFLTPDPLHFLRQLLSFLHYVVSRGATVVFTSEPSRSHPDDDLRSLSDGTIQLGFDRAGRRISVDKLRGSGFRPGAHTLKITDRGMRVYPRLRAAELPTVPDRIASRPLGSGIPGLDAFLHGGIEQGSIALLTGPSGTGKTTVGMSFMKELARRGERSVVLAFDESLPMLARRCEALGLPVLSMVDQGTLELIPVDPLAQTADEIAHAIRREVEGRGASAVMLDSIAGYARARRRCALVDDVYAICKYLTARGVTTILVDEARNVAGGLRPSEFGIDFLADKILFFRYMERRNPDGTVELRKTIGVLKKRSSDFEKTLRELEFIPGGITIGEAMPRLQAIVSAMPIVEYSDAEDDNAGSS